MSDPNPRFVEAYPRLDLFAARKAMEAGTDLCRFIDEHGQCVGDAFTLDVNSSPLHLHFCFRDSYFLGGKGIAALVTERAPVPSDPGRLYFRCGGCDRRVRFLVWDDDWACSQCRGLHYRIQLLPPDVMRFEEMMRLRGKIGMGRPHRMRQDTYRGQKKRLNALGREFKRKVPVASVVHSRRIEAIWVLSSDLAGEQLSGENVRAV